jgi:hypothetical protein
MEALHAQDKICLENGVRQAKVADISLSSVRYTLVDRPDVQLILPLRRVLILFNSDGDYLVPSQMDSTNPNIRIFLNRFFSTRGAVRSKDQVFTLQRTVVEVKIDREDDNNIYWAGGQMGKKDIAAIIYTDGNSKVLCPIAEAAEVLGACHRTPLNLGVASDLVATREAPSENTKETPANSKESPANTRESSSNTRETPATTKESEPVLTAVKGTGGTAQQDSSINSRVNALLGGVSRQEFVAKAEKKTAQFTDYLKVLCDKSAGYEELDKAISQAVSLFVNEDAMVEVSSNNRNSIFRLKIRDYLRKVKQVQYDRIEVKWTHVQYVSDLKPGPDGNLYGTVSFEQEFQGYRDGKLVYSDVTLKHANVVLKTYSKTYEGSTRKIWDVLLSDVGVVATKSL